MQDLEKTLISKKLHDVRSNLYNHIRDVGKSSNLPLLLDTERDFIKDDLFRYANSKAMVSSLKMALVEIDVIKDHVVLVSDPKQYQSINRDHSLPKNRKGRLPYDEARQAMASHYTRLGNLDKARSTAAEKLVIEVRRDNMKIMRRLYEKMQAKAIGIDLKNDKDFSL
ncbi:hypothetical protein [Bartonella sp. C271]|uniref:hypothetical protein n=1 Tax=Bartonella sp. C271 TaxID=3070220 RepID=UPI0038B5855A